MKDLIETANIIHKIVDEMDGKLLPRTLTQVRSLLQHREYGVAFEMLVDCLYEDDVEIQPQTFILFEQAANRMKMTEEKWKFIKELVGNG